MSDVPLLLPGVVEGTEIEVFEKDPDTGKPITAKFDKRTIRLEALRDRFVASNLTVKDFAKEEGIEHSSAIHLAKRWRWQEERELARQQASAETRKRLVNKTADVEERIDLPTHRAAKRLTRVIASILENVHEQQKRASEGDPNAKRLGLDDLPKLRAGVEALREAHRLTRTTAHLAPEPLPTGVDLNLGNLSPDEAKLLQALLKKAERKD